MRQGWILHEYNPLHTSMKTEKAYTYVLTSNRIRTENTHTYMYNISMYFTKLFEPLSKESGISIRFSSRFGLVFGGTYDKILGASVEH